MNKITILNVFANIIIILDALLEAYRDYLYTYGYIDIGVSIVVRLLFYPFEKFS